MVERRADRLQPMKPLLLVAIVLAALMPSVPEPTDPVAIAFAVSAGLLYLRWFTTTTMSGALPKSASGAWLILFIALVLLSATTSMLFETPFDLWLRGAIPFFFLLTFFPALQIANRDPHWVLDVLHLSAVAWLVTTMTATLVAVPAVLSGEVQRITHATEAWAAFQLPYAMVGLALTLFHPSRWLHAMRWPLAFVFSCVPLLAVSRGQIAAVVLIWLVYFIRLPARAKRRAAFPVLLLVTGIAVLVWQSALQEALFQRFSETGAGDGSRWLEFEYAFGQFLESPLLGKGLGHQIPAEVTFAGDWEMIASAGVDTVGYMHNVIGYLLMNLGLPGLIAYVGFVASAISAPRRAIASHDQAGQLAALTIVVVIFGWWFMVQPSFRHIQSNILLAVTLAVLTALRTDRSRGAISDARPA
jgi:O-antigen ligase